MLAKPEVKNIIPIRKSGKLPFNEGDLREVAVVKEYGTDKLFYRVSDIAAGELSADGAFHISIVDDVLATAARPRASPNRSAAARWRSTARSIP